MEDIMDEEEETEGGVDFGISLGDVVLVETEGNLMAGTFLVHSDLGIHIRMTHELDEVQDKLGADAVDTVLEGIDEMDDFELIEMAVELEVAEPWKCGRKTLRAIVASKLLKDATPPARQVLVAKAHPITRIIPDANIVTIDLLDDWKAENVLRGLDFEPEIDDEEEDEDDVPVPEPGDA